MGDSTDGSTGGSSIAARSAQADSQDTNEESSTEQSGFFRKMFGALSLNEATPSEDVEEKPAPAAVGMLNLRTLAVEDVAIPRSDIVAVPIESNKEELVTTFRESGLTRLPVYEGTLDMPLGMIHLKDVALRHVFNGNGDSFDLRPMVRPLLYAPPSMPIGVLLQKMQNQRMHIDRKSVV